MASASFILADAHRIRGEGRQAGAGLEPPDSQAKTRLLIMRRWETPATGTQS
eukprot:m.496726 g.496726  ORF g.496726 m.496726 type:complete len:52 (+) comp148407_c0_seq1:60-215(+)